MISELIIPLSCFICTSLIIYITHLCYIVISRLVYPAVKNIYNSITHWIHILNHGFEVVLSDSEDEEEELNYTNMDNSKRKQHIVMKDLVINNKQLLEELKKMPIDMPKNNELTHINKSKVDKLMKEIEEIGINNFTIDSHVHGITVDKVNNNKVNDKVNNDDHVDTDKVDNNDHVNDDVRVNVDVDDIDNEIDNEIDDDNDNILDDDEVDDSDDDSDDDINNNLNDKERIAKLMKRLADKGFFDTPPN